LSPEQVGWLITRPREGDRHGQPRWLVLLRSLLGGIYTIDNMDFVLRDAYMSGYSQRSYDLDRLLHYSFFTDRGLTIHDRGMNALMRFMAVRGELFRTIYFHRTVRAIDLTLADVFADSRTWIFPGSPLDHLDRYLELTEWSLLTDVSRWPSDEDEAKRALGQRWRRFLQREIPWKMVAQRTRVFAEGDAEQSSIFSDARFLEQKIREQLPAELRELPMRVDIARHMQRPHTRGPSGGQNFLYDSARDEVRPLDANELYSKLPTSQRICRIYAQAEDRAGELARALDTLIGGATDDTTNM
jgi:HD superfamily phosphohydrolase